MSLTHALASPSSAHFLREREGDIYFNSLDTAYMEGQSVSLGIALGRTGQPLLDVAGLAFSVNFNPSKIKSGSMSFDFSDTWVFKGATPYDQLTLTQDHFSQGRFLKGASI